MNNSEKEDICQFAKFNMVGIINTFIDLMIFYVLNQYLDVFYSAAHTISTLCAMVNSYVLNKRWTFKKIGTSKFIEIIKFILLNLISTLITLIVFYLIKKATPLPNMIIKVIIVFISAVLNFIGSRMWVFK